MRLRRKLYIGTALLFALVSGAVLLLRENEPHYQGQPLSYWVKGLSAMSWPPSEGHAPSYSQSKAAISNIGTNAIPFLLRWIAYEETPSKMRSFAAKVIGSPPFLKDLQPVRAWLDRPWIEKVRAEACPAAFAALGTRASGAVPSLQQLACRPIPADAVATRAADALLQIGPVALPALACVATNGDSGVQPWATTALGFFRTNAAIPALLHNLASTNAPVAVCAVEVMAAIGLESHLVVPALTNALSYQKPMVKRSIISALAEFSKEAPVALPAVVAALQDPDAQVRSNATNTLLAIAPDYFTNSPSR